MNDLFENRYRVLEEIGRGGMGRVFSVYDTIRNETLALKELSRRYTADASAMLEFKKEFRVMTEFQHSGIVRVFDFGVTQDNVPYITMELVSGKNLSDWSQLSVPQIIDILIGLCEILRCIHSRLYVHRDLKPDNIKYLPDGSVKLLDFGLMSQLGVSGSGKISGTYYYMAPEVILGGIIDQTTDLYSVGIIGYELLTGRRPFSGTKTQILQGHLKQIPPAPAVWRPDIPESVQAIIMKLIEKDKDRRYRNTSEVLRDLQRLKAKGEKPKAEIRVAEHVLAGYVYSSKLIGREEEISRFTQYLERLKTGQSGALFIGSPAGIGKTRLLKEMKIIAELEGVRTVYSEAHSWRIETVKPDPSVPTVWLVDDIHWMDTIHLQQLNELIRHPASLLIVAAFRNDEADKTSPLWHTIEEDLTEYRKLAPLSAEQIRLLIEKLLYPSEISDEFIEYCFQNSGGNVFDLIELLKYLIGEGLMMLTETQWVEPVNLDRLLLPASLEERLMLRIRKLDPEAIELAQTAAVLGDDLNLELWQAVSEFTDDRFFKAIDELMLHQIIIKTDEMYRFAHDTIRTAIYQDLDEERKTTIHRKSAQILEAHVGGECGERISVIARHYTIAQDADKAIEYGLKAARRAEAEQAEWEAFEHYRNVVRFLEPKIGYPNQENLLSEIYEKAGQFSCAAWIDAATCLNWLEKVVQQSIRRQNWDKVFSLSLSYLVTCAITGNYATARRKLPEIIGACQIQENTLAWAILYGAGVCLVDWYQGYQQDCFNHAAAAIEIFEKQLDTLPQEAWPAYSWSLFWREKARAYLGEPVEMRNVEKIHQLMLDGKSDKTIYWHTLTAVTARAAFTGRWADLLKWKQQASQLSKEMGKIYWFECWISHSYLYAALLHGEFSQIKSHIERVNASPDPYQVRLAWLFQGIWALIRCEVSEAEQHLVHFIESEQQTPDNSYPEGFVYLSKLYLAVGAWDKAADAIQKGFDLTSHGPRENPLYQLQFLQLKAELAMTASDDSITESCLNQSLHLAQSLDNPIQTGFIYKLWGKWYLARQMTADAMIQFTKAKELFLSIDNLYQANQIPEIIESLDRARSSAIATMSSEEIQKDTQTRLEETVGGEP